MFRYILILLILFISINRYNQCLKSKRNPNFLLLSTLIQIIPLSGIIYKFYSIKLPFGIISGAADSFLAIDVLWIILIAFSFFFKLQTANPSLRANIGNNYFIFGFLVILEIINLSNPYNSLPSAGLPVFARILQLFIFLVIISKYLSYNSILEGFYDGFKRSLGLQFIITTLFPVLHITFVSRLFREEVSDWAFRRDAESAIGTFMHPGALALFCCMTAIFFLSCYLNKYKEKDSIIRIMMSLYVIFFTFSRTSYLAVIGTLFLLFFIYRNRVNFQIKNVLLIITGILIVSCLFLLTPLGDMFFKSDVDIQIQNRELHYLLALGCYNDSPLFGVGLNNHVNYIYNDLNTSLIGGNIGLFFLTNPVHNSHLIILAETGLIGFSLWCYYFVSRIYRSFRYCITKNNAINILNFSFGGILIVYMLYGMTGWSCFHREIYPILIIVGFFTVLKK